MTGLFVFIGFLIFLSVGWALYDDYRKKKESPTDRRRRLERAIAVLEIKLAHTQEELDAVRTEENPPQNRSLVA